MSPTHLAMCAAYCSGRHPGHIKVIDCCDGCVRGSRATAVLSMNCASFLCTVRFFSCWPTSRAGFGTSDHASAWRRSEATGGTEMPSSRWMCDWTAPPLLVLHRRHGQGLALGDSRHPTTYRGIKVHKWRRWRTEGAGAGVMPAHAMPPAVVQIPTATYDRVHYEPASQLSYWIDCVRCIGDGGYDSRIGWASHAMGTV